MKTWKIILSVLLLFVIIISTTYFETTKTRYGGSCVGYNWVFPDSRLVCQECDFKFNPKLIVDGFDFKQRYLDGCKRSQLTDGGKE